MFIGCDSLDKDVIELIEDMNGKSFSYGNFRINLVAAAGDSSDVKPASYWSSTKIGNITKFWCYSFYEYGEFCKPLENYVRAVLAF